MQSRSGRTRYKVKTIGRLKDRKSGKVIKSFKESGGGKKPLIGKKTGGVMKAMGGKMAKGYSKGGARMMKAMGGKMAKGYSKGGARMMRARGGKMAKGYSKGGARMMKASLGGLTMVALKKALGKVRPGFKMSDPIMKKDLERAAKYFTTGKVPTPATKKASAAALARRRKTPIPVATRKKPSSNRIIKYGGAAGVGAIAQEQTGFLGGKKKKKMSAFETSFAKARKAGKKTFTYKGKKYTTKLKK